MKDWQQVIVCEMCPAIARRERGEVEDGHVQVLSIEYRGRQSSGLFEGAMLSRWGNGLDSAQVRILSEILEAPEGWRQYATNSENDELSDKVVGDVLQKLNAVLKQHNRIVYSSQAVHHVAQQIASLYWTSITQASRSEHSLERGVEKTVDLSSHVNISQLPVELQDPSASEEERFRYQQLREHLISLDNRRQQRQRRLDQLRQLKRLLEPFQAPQENIQPNLVTRDGELMQELEKMRMLVARVGGRINQSQRASSHESNASYPLGADQKLEALFDMM
ncbi:kinetochore subunit FTA4 family protein [Aspergillus tanneri]|uniref:Kinetochore protein fta4 n=1 Tax=Aspergillus tanneri TaxID=1220188 RepID=A0A5M9N0Q4_9EURO|nr:uncharacterized protein ATNIH1004_000724 [Aspergillus tanneri]KAA8651826.1 hypothetical protein ATNIH1004_000724 [Aspergillus tanneri]